MNRMSSYLKFLVFVILFSFIATSFSFTQEKLQDNTNKKIEEMIQKITTKLLLSDLQKDKVKLILQDYFKGLQNISSETDDLKKLQADSELKILNIFDSRQKMKFDIIKDEWWDLASK